MVKSYEYVRSSPSLKMYFVFGVKSGTGSEASGNILWIPIKNHILPKSF